MRAGARARKPTRADLLARISALEARVATLETMLGTSKPAAVRNELKKPAGPKCPGCRLDVLQTRDGRCNWCGFVFDVVPQMKKLADKG